jgi:hypothetical protein
MRRATILSLSCLVLCSSVAFGQGGINLSWNDCGSAGTERASFACDANTGPPFELVASFVPPGKLPEFLGLNAQIDLEADSPTMPSWWALATGECRTGALSVSFDFTSGPSTCVDFFSGQAAGGFVYEEPQPGRRRIRITCAVPFDNRGPIDPGTEYYAFKVRVARAKTTGAGACAGCNDHVCMRLDHIQLFQPPEQGNDPLLANPAERAEANWQNGFCVPCPCPTQLMSFGQLKCKFR